jgi:hypothetical protein
MEFLELEYEPISVSPLIHLAVHLNPFHQPKQSAQYKAGALMNSVPLIPSPAFGCYLVCPIHHPQIDMFGLLRIIVHMIQRASVASCALL